MATKRQNLIRTADKVFSLYVRHRGSTFGYNHCFTCGKYLPLDELQAGHFINRRFFNVRWHILNVWAQCNTCNVEKHGNLVKYEAKLRAQYSDLAVDALFDLSRENNGGLSDYEIREIIDKYK